MGCNGDAGVRLVLHRQLLEWGLADVEQHVGRATGSGRTWAPARLTGGALGSLLGPPRCNARWKALPRIGSIRATGNQYEGLHGVHILMAATTAMIGGAAADAPAAVASGDEAGGSGAAVLTGLGGPSISNNPIDRPSCCAERWRAERVCHRAAARA